MLAWIRALASRTRASFSPRQLDQEFEHELDAHLDMLADENVRRGMSPEEARRAARIRLGGQTQLKEINRELHGLPVLETFFQDTRYAFRMLRKNPGFTAVAVLTLALGMGANTAIFSVVYAMLLKPLPYSRPDQLLTVFEAQPQAGVNATGWSYANFAELREQNRIFSDMAGSQQHQLTLTGRGEPSVVNTSVVTPELFSVFGQRPILGRPFYPDDGKPGAPAAVVLSENLWRGSFGADPKVIGSSINLDKRSFTIVGVMPAVFRFPILTESEQLWIPLVQDPLFGSWMDRRGGRAPSHGAAEAGRFHDASASGAGCHRREAGQGVSRRERRLDHPLCAAQTEDRRKCEVRTARAYGRRRPRAPDRLRQYRQSSSHAGDFSSARDCRAHGPWRRPIQNCSATA
jgi:hypothetical protein